MGNKIIEPKLTINEVASVIECEEFGYAVQHYMSGDRIADPYLADMWIQCADLMNSIQRYIEDNADPDEDGLDELDEDLEDEFEEDEEE